MDKKERYKELNAAIKIEPAKEIWDATTVGSVTGFYVLIPHYEDGEGSITDFILSFANEAAAKQFGLRLEELEGKNLGDVLPFHQEYGYFSQYRQCFITKLPYVGEFEVPTSGGHHVKYVQEVTPTREALVVKNRLPDTHFASNISNVAMASKIQLQKDRISMLEKMIEEAGHDLKTTLSVIKMSLYLAQKTEDTGKRFEYENQAGAQIQRLSDIIEEMVDVAKKRESEWMKFTVYSLHEFMDLYSEQAKALVGGYKRFLNIERGATYSSILIVKEKLYRAIDNLIRNAINYTRDGDTIFIGCHEDHENAYIYVKDKGIGIPKDKLDKVFEKFYRVDIDRSRVADVGNQGLGLSIAREIVDMHGGTITVSSEVNVGTTFTIVLPRYGAITDP